MAEYDITYFAELATALTDVGIATWNLEYRRVSNPGGGWPGTFLDAARGTDHLRTLVAEHDRDLGRVIAAGHSTGGHLALWLATRHALSADSELYVADPLDIRGVLALAPAAHLAPLHSEGTCDAAVDRLMGGSPATYPRRYRDGSPAEMVPLRVPQIVIVGQHDETWRPNGEAYVQVASRAADTVEMRVAKESGHFEMIAPKSTHGRWSSRHFETCWTHSARNQRLVDRRAALREISEQPERHGSDDRYGDQGSQHEDREQLCEADRDLRFEYQCAQL